MSAQENDRGRVKSVEQGVLLLKQLAGGPGSMSLKNIAAAAKMAPSKAHRYLVSLCATGMVEQDIHSGHYRLGSASLHLGLAALTRLDLVREAESCMEQLCRVTGETVLLSVWGNNGPTIIKMHEPARPVTVNVRVGFSLPLLSSATGLVFSAYLPAQQLEEPVAAELSLLVSAKRNEMPKNRTELARLMQQVRQRGLSRVKGALLAGINSLGAPVFDHESQLAAVLTVLGAANEINSNWNGPVARALRQAGLDISKRLGFQGIAEDAD